MSKFLILCLIIADTFAVLATGAKIGAQTEREMASFSFADAPSLSPSYNNGKSNLAKAPTIRKLGKHKKEELEPSQSLIPSHAPSSEVNSLGQESEMSQMHLEKKHHHHNIDKSIAGGGVILGGLATMFLVAVFCYIRATRRKSIEPSV